MFASVGFGRACAKIAPPLGTPREVLEICAVPEGAFAEVLG